MLITWRKNGKTASGKRRRRAKGEQASEELFSPITVSRNCSMEKESVVKLARGIRGKRMWIGKKKGEREWRREDEPGTS